MLGRRAVRGAPFVMASRRGEGADRPTPRTIQIMTDNTAPSLRDLVFTTGSMPVIDELAALDMLLPERPNTLERHATLLERLPSLLDLRGRALLHAQQYERFLALAEVDPLLLEDRVDTANALAILAHAGEIAMLLVPPSAPEDDFAQTMVAQERARQYGGGDGRHDPALMKRALRATYRPGGMRLTLGAVSYTHLDVYKRQMRRPSSGSSR